MEYPCFGPLVLASRRRAILRRLSTKCDVADIARDASGKRFSICGGVNGRHDPQFAGTEMVRVPVALMQGTSRFEYSQLSGQESTTPQSWGRRCRAASCKSRSTCPCGAACQRYG